MHLSFGTIYGIVTEQVILVVVVCTHLDICLSYVYSISNKSLFMTKPSEIPRLVTSCIISGPPTPVNFVPLLDSNFVNMSFKGRKHLGEIALERDGELVFIES